MARGRNRSDPMGPPVFGRPQGLKSSNDEMRREQRERVFWAGGSGDVDKHH